MISVVIPAHDEARVIARCLRTLVAGAEADELEVVVACNGCTDDTASIARSASDLVRVVETDLRSKTAALNLGDAEAHGFPRFYVDADVLVTFADLRAVADVMAEEGFLAGAPQLRLDYSGASAAVRAHLGVWQELPYVREALVGSGVYGLTEQGRARFGEFPDLIADDLFVRQLFRPDERASVAGTSFVVDAPGSYRALLRRNARVFAGNALYRAEVGAAPGETGNTVGGSFAALGDIVRAHPRQAPAVLLYACGTLVSKAMASWRVRRASTIAWSAHR